LTDESIEAIRRSSNGSWLHTAASRSALIPRESASSSKLAMRVSTSKASALFPRESRKFSSSAARWLGGSSRTSSHSAWTSSRAIISSSGVVAVDTSSTRSASLSGCRFRSRSWPALYATTAT